MRKTGIILALLMLVPFAGCSSAPTDSGQSGETGVEITVVSPFDSSDGNHDNYVAAYTAYEEETGNSIIDDSAVVNEAWKAEVLASFDEGTEPDVVFYFTGADANSMVENGEVVSLGEIRREYPHYASNMKDSMISVSPADGRQYAVPVNGYWEGLYVNKTVLAACGIEVPGSSYTWEQFLQDCQIIKDNGYVPVACSLGEVPHYWFEYCTFNNGDFTSHTVLPETSADSTGLTWAAGLDDIKDLYNRGFFPAETATMTDDESCELFITNEAAFLLDGSWKLGWIQTNAENIDNFTVTYVPAMGERKPTEIIGGLSMGYYITQQAWDDPAKREACVSFVMAMTTDEVVNSFGALSITALKEGTTPPLDADSLVMAALAMTRGSTGVAAAAQDGLTPDARVALFADVKYIVWGDKTPEEAIDDCLIISSITPNVS